jgi:hypothetical protein
VSGNRGWHVWRAMRHAARVRWSPGFRRRRVLRPFHWSIGPLGAFAGLLPEAVRTDDALELMRRSVESLRREADGRPVVVGVDDGQLLDPVSAALVCT